MDKKDKIRSFTDLVAWQRAHGFVLDIYKLTKNFPSEEKFGLSSQIRRSSASISSNIAEGFGRSSYREKVQFYFVSKGSLTETQNHLILARDLGYISNEQYNSIYSSTYEISKLLKGLIQSSRARS